MLFFNDLYYCCRFCYDDDLYTISSAYRSSCNGHLAAVSQHPYHDVPINSLKHRLLVHLYRRATADARAAGTPKPVLVFFRHFDEFRRLRMWKMQLLDENHLIIRSGCYILICSVESRKLESIKQIKVKGGPYIGVCSSPFHRPLSP